MSKLKIDKLQYPLWFNIVFYILTIALPLISIMIQGYKSESPMFRWTFAVITGLLILWMFVYKFIIVKHEKKLQDREVNLEHDYEIDVGNKEKIKQIWFTNQLWLTIFEAVKVALIGAVLILLGYGISTAALKIKGVSVLIILCYLAAYVMKFVVISVLKNKEEKEDTTNEERTE